MEHGCGGKFHLPDLITNLVHGKDCDHDLLFKISRIFSNRIIYLRSSENFFYGRVKKIAQVIDRPGFQKIG